MLQILRWNRQFHLKLQANMVARDRNPKASQPRPPLHTPGCHFEQ
jgi:hypothetical protein